MTRDELYELLIDNSKDTPKVSLKEILKQEEESKKKLEEHLENQKIFDKIMKDLNDSDPDIRYAAINHLNATSEHIDKALNDSDWRVRGVAKRRLKEKLENT